ncbi:MAG: YdcF family protein [Sedimenticola sp.]
MLGIIFWHRPILGRGLVIFVTLVTLLLSLPIVSDRLIQVLEPYPALNDQQLDAIEADAIVVLSGDRKTRAPEFGTDTVGSLTLQRIRYAAWLHRRTKLPLYVSGGGAKEDRSSLAHIMREVLEDEFDVTVSGIEDESGDTQAQAINVSEILSKEGKQHILLVSHAWHLPRAIGAFHQAGLQTTPAPTSFGHHPKKSVSPVLFVMSANAFQTSAFAVHELFGIAWYKIRQWLSSF